jgi:hypothetical protein
MFFLLTDWFINSAGKPLQGCRRRDGPKRAVGKGLPGPRFPEFVEKIGESNKPKCFDAGGGVE